MSETRAWTLATARAIIDDVRSRTALAVESVDGLMEKREALLEKLPENAKTSDELTAVEREIDQRVSRWAREMEALGVEVKRPWLVDFDNGSGYFCWRWPEEQLEFFHGYDEGFEGRLRIQ